MDPSRGVQAQKARCSIRGELMRPGTHYDPYGIQCPSADMSTVRMIFEIEAAHVWSMEHMDIVNAYVHYQPIQPNPI